jgi:hypothetical protein
MLDLREFNHSQDEITLNVEVHWDNSNIETGSWYFEGVLLELQTERITRKQIKEVQPIANDIHEEK